MKRVLIVSVLGFAAAGLAAYLARPSWLPSWVGGPDAAASAESGLYCKEHGVPEKFCTLCHEELKQTLLFCKEHGDVPEDICTLCHPEVKEKHNIATCEEHGLPASFCYLCEKGPGVSLGAPDDGWCAAHGTPEEFCRECDVLRSEGGPLPISSATSKACREPLPLVRLASAKLADRLGFKTVEATEEEHAHKLIANAETAYDANHYAEITPRANGFVREVRVDLGHKVKRGDVLCVIESAEVSAAKALYLSSRASLALARATADRTVSLRAPGRSPRRRNLRP